MWAGLCLLSFWTIALRGAAWWRSAAIFNDGPRFLRQAQLFEAGRWDAALADPYHPLYALAIAAVRRLGAAVGVEGSWEAIGVGVSIAGGTVAMLCLWGFVRDAFGGVYPWIAATLFAVHSRAIEYTSDVQSEGIYLACFLAGVWAAWRALSRRSPAAALAAGCAAGAAYWARPEGLGLALVAGAVLCAAAWRQGWPRSAALRCVGALALGAVLWVAPYPLLAHAVTGQWSLTQKKSVAEFLGGERAASEAAVPRAVPDPVVEPTHVPPLPHVLGTPRQGPATWDQGLSAAADLFDTLRSSPRSAIWVAVIWGVWVCVRRDGFGLRGWFVAALALAYTGLLAQLVLEAGYVSRRHALPPFLPAFGYAAVGTAQLGGLLTSAWARLRGARTRQPAAEAAAAVGCAVMAIISLSHQWEPRRLDKLAERRAAEWLGAETGGVGRLAGSGARIGYYSGMEFADLTRVAPSELPATLIGTRVDYAIVNREAFVDALRFDPRFHLRHEEQVAGEQAFVFQFDPPAIP